MKWRDAIDLALRTLAQKNGQDETGQTRITNRDASGLILFGREAVKLAKKSHAQTAAPFDWYFWSKPVLGWFNRGDRFMMDAEHEKQQMPPALNRGMVFALDAVADSLDAARVPFKVVRDPRGTEGTYKAMAMDAYREMQRRDPASADVHPHKKIPPSKLPQREPRPVIDTPPIIVPVPVEVAPATPTHPAVVVPQPMVQPGPPTPMPPPPHQLAQDNGAPDGGGVAPGGGDGDDGPAPAPQPQRPPRARPGRPLPHPADAPIDPGAWYWKKHEHDTEAPVPDDDPPPPPPFQPVPNAPEMVEWAKNFQAWKDRQAARASSQSESGGAGAILLLLLAAFAFSD